MLNMRGLSTFRELYVLNGESLMRGSVRSQLLGQCVLIIESLLIFSLLLNPAYLKHDSSESGFLRFISLHYLSTENQTRTVIAILAFNTITAIALIILFAVFFHKPFQKLSIPVLSQFILNYNHIFLIPSLLFSIMGLHNDSFSSSDYALLFYINLTLTFLISLISAIHSGRFYQYFDCDSLSKHGSNFDYLKPLSFAATIFLVEVFDYFKDYYPIWITAIISISMWDMLLHENIYYSLQMAHLAVTLNLSNIAQAIIVFIQINSNESQRISAIVPFLCTPILAYKVAERIIEAHTTRTMQLIDAYLIVNSSSSSSSSSNNKLGQNSFNLDSSIQFPVKKLISNGQKAYLVDYFTRRCMESTEFISKEQKVLLSLQKHIFRFPNEPQHDENKDHLGRLIEAEESFSLNSLKSQVKQLNDCLDLHIQNSRHANNHLNNSNNQSNYSSSFCVRNRFTTISSLFYLLEIEQNFPKLAIKLKEYQRLRMKKRSLRDESLLWHLEQEMNEREHNQRMKISSSDATTIFSVKQIDLSTAFTFQEDLQNLKESIMNSLNMKVEFLNEISQDCIQIEDMARNGISLVESNLKISNIILSLQARSKHCDELSLLNHAFLSCLWIDPRDKKYKLNWKRSINSLHSNNFSRNPSRSSPIKSQNQYENRINFKKINLSECSVLVSLNELRFGRILKVSENSLQITGFASSELIGQDCSIIQPASIGINHNSIIRQGIDDGLLRFQDNEQSPLIMKRKDGSGVRVSLRFQVHMIDGLRESCEIALIANVCIQEMEFEKYFLADIQKQGLRIEVTSQFLFHRLLRAYFNSPSNLCGLNLGQIIPAIINISQFFEFHGENQVKFQSLGFFPTTSSEEQKRLRLNDFSQDWWEIAQKGYLKKSQNDIFLMELSAKNYKRNGSYNTLILKIKQFRKVSDEFELAVLLKNILAPQLVHMQGMSVDDQALIVDTILECDTPLISYQQIKDDASAFFSEQKLSNQSKLEQLRIVSYEEQQKKYPFKNQVKGDVSNAIKFLQEDNHHTARNDSTHIIGEPFLYDTLLEPPITTIETTKRQLAVSLDQQSLAQQQMHISIKQQPYQQDQQSLVQLTNPKQSAKEFSQEKQEIQSILSPNQLSEQNDHLKVKEMISSRGLLGSEKSEKYLFSNSSINKPNTRGRQHFSCDEQDEYSPPAPSSNRKYNLKAIIKRTIEDANYKKEIQSFCAKQQHLRLSQQPSTHKPLDQHFSTRELQRQQEFEKILFDEESNNVNPFPEQQESDNPNNELRDSILGTIANTIQSVKTKKNYNNNTTKHRQRDGGDSDQNEKVNSDHQSTSSQVSSMESNSLKSTLYHLMFNSRQSTIQISLISYILLSFLSILSIVILMYLQMKSSLSQQSDSFEFSWWSDQAFYEITSILRYSKAKQLLDLISYRPTFAEDQWALLNSIPSIIEAAYSNFVDRLRVLSSQNYDSLFLVQQLYALSGNYTSYLDVESSRMIKVSLISFIELAGYSCYQLAQPWYSQAMLTELESINNLSAYSPLLMELSNALSDEQQSMADKMNSLVLRALIVILSISFAISCILLPFYYEFESKREFILRLFASVDPLSLKRMHENCFDQLQLIKSNRRMKEESGKFLRRQRTLLTSPRKFCVKKKKNVHTTPLRKLSFYFVLQIFSIMILINVQPIVNVILISAQMSEAKTEYTIVQGLYSLQKAITTAQYAIFSHTTILAVPSLSYISPEAVYVLFVESYNQFKKLLLNFSSVIQQLSTNQRFDNTEMGVFISSLLTGDMCLTLKNAKDSYFDKSEFDSSICILLYNGINQTGLLQNLKKFELIFQLYAEIASIQVLDLEVQQMYEEFYAANSIPNLDHMLLVVQQASKAIVNCIREEKESFYQKISISQLFLFLFEIVFLVILLPTVVHSFFQKIQNQMSNSIRMLSILQIQQIYENSYISNFIRKNSKT